MEHPSFQFHTPIQDEATISHVSVKRRIPSKDETLTFSAFANRHNDRQNDISESLEMNYSDSDLPSHLTITDSVQDRFIRSDPVIETPQTNYKKRTKDILPIDLIGSSTSKQLKRKRQRVVIQRDIGFDQASESRSSADQDLPLSIEENQSHLTNNSYRQHSRHSRRHSNGSGAINTTPLRLCEHCDTSVTTGWRKGPTGRPTLCNRCGSFYAIHNKLPIPKSDTALNVSRSSLLDPPEYLPGDRVWAYSSYDGYYHSATIKGSEEREHIYRVLFDDRRHNGDSNSDGQKNKSKVTLDTSHLRPLTLMVNTQVWIMRMGQRTLKQARIQAVDLDEERCRVHWLTEDGREESTTASISPWISISRIALPVTSLLDDIDMIEADMASNNNHETPKEKLLVEEDVEEDVEEEEVKKVTEKKEKNTVLDVTAPEFINSLLGPSLNLVDNEQDSPMLSNQLLFKDMVFVLTNIPSKSDNDGKKEDSLITCTKEQLTQMIEEHGGRISSNLFGSHSINEHGSSIVTSTILLCGEVKRTKKHLLALAMNIPRVSYKWINDAIHTGQTDTMLNYLLCNGFSIELNAYVASRPAISLLSNDGDSERNNRLLAGLIIHLKGGISFKNDWEAVLKAAGAIIADRKQLTSVGCDYIVVEKRPTPSWLNSLSTMTRGRMKAVVTSEWVAQCLINQRIVHWQGHPSYTKWS
ncbi:hypothetical protein BDF19DRAFT_261770 [Syncephalis fuscata]|nr:hypothetical protein BDF19DRAFT_261770 [Syncephalis fuscata]